MCAKEIGAKMKRKEAIGDDESVPPEVVDKLHNQTITAEDMRVSVDSIHIYETSVSSLLYSDFHSHVCGF